MIKVVLDANLFVSAVLTSKGKPAKIFDLVRAGKIEMITSFPILEEVRMVLLYPRLKKLHGFSQKEVEKELKKIAGFAKLTTGKLKIEAIKNDPSDDKYLECAMEGEAEFIVSGDHHLKDLKLFQGVRIVSPAEFVRIFA